MKSETSPCTGSVVREGRKTRLVDGSFNKKESALWGLSGAATGEQITHLSARNLKTYIEALTGFSHVFSSDDLSNTLLSQGYVLGTTPRVGVVGGIYSPKIGKGWGTLMSNC